MTAAMRNGDMAARPDHTYKLVYFTSGTSHDDAFARIRSR